jgi:glutathione S-transferase
VRKARVVMAEKKLDYVFELENVWGAETRIAASNPLGKVPCLVMEDGSMMYDSRVIAEYLDTLTPVCKLLPQNSRDRANVKVLGSAGRRRARRRRAGLPGAHLAPGRSSRARTGSSASWARCAAA